MEYAEAVKKVKAEKPKDNFMTVHIDAHLILPHKDGVLLLQALSNAERFPRYYSDPKVIEPLDGDIVTTQPMSWQTYEQHKIAALLGVSFDTVKDMAKKAADEAKEKANTQ